MLRNPQFLAAGILAAGVWIAAPACASSGYYSYQRDYRDFDRRAYDVGYRDGLAHGEDDARHRREFRIDRDGDYRHADDGYRREYGDRDSYRRAFRQRYEAGYSEGFNRVARSSGRFSSPAAQNGSRDGLEVGRRDARDGQRFDPVRAKWYRAGDRDYDRRYGSRSDYQRDYRAAFQQGYEQGFRNGRMR